MKRELKYVKNHFDELVVKYNVTSESDDDDYKTQKLGDYNLLWRTTDVLWVNAYEEIGSYEGSAIQVGVSRKGELVLESQSHCSCYGWSNSILEQDMIFSNFKTKLAEIDSWDRDIILNGECPTPIAGVEPKFWKTLKEILADFKQNKKRVGE